MSISVCRLLSAACAVSPGWNMHDCITVLLKSVCAHTVVGHAARYGSLFAEWWGGAGRGLPLGCQECCSNLSPLPPGQPVAMVCLGCCNLRTWCVCACKLQQLAGGLLVRACQMHPAVVACASPWCCIWKIVAIVFFCTGSLRSFYLQWGQCFASIAVHRGTTTAECSCIPLAAVGGPAKFFVGTVV